MAAKKAASKTRKKVTTSRKKVAAKKVSKKKVARKKAAKKAVARKKVAKKAGKKKVSKKKVTRKKVAKKKVAKKPPSRKKAAKKVAKKASRKKAVAKKKVVRKKRPATRKKVARKTSVRRSGPRGNVLAGPIHGIEPYKPSRGEEYMSDTQLDHFHEILSAWKEELMFEVDRTVHHMQDEAANFPDPNDRATQESEFGLELRTRDRERKLLRKIDSALIRIENGSYGFCDETGEEIGLKRLEAQERRELAERQFRDRDDRYR